ncbi:MAG TPA: hypothetical protein VLF89_03455 [Candidatus Saccharimonadales bacterium]|nr:hypothetical protein [Candidatus Saccharimonadales bacterium]
MKKTIILFYKTTVFPYFILVICLILAGLFTYIISSKPKIAGIKTNKTTIIPSLSPTPIRTVLGKQNTEAMTPPKETTSPTISPSSTPVVNQPSITLPQPTITVTPSVTISPTIASREISPTPTQTINTVSLQIETPEGSSRSAITLKDGVNVCDVLDEAKNEGKISSVTFDDTYMSSLHSKYVYEINGYKNNWTFTVNNTSPLGCSLFNPKPNDSIVWKFG